MIKNIIFDLGNVVLKLKWNKILDEFGKNSDEKDLLNKAIFNSKEWLDLDEGVISKEEGIKRMLTNLPSNLHESCINIMSTWTNALEINNEMLNFIEKMRNEGYKTYILSNAPHDIPIFLKEKNLEKYFDGKIISAEELLVKPNPEIYKLLLERFSLKPEECIFFDDKKENIDTAIKCKLNGYVYDYNNHNQFLEYISKILK